MRACPLLSLAVSVGSATEDKSLYVGTDGKVRYYTTGAAHLVSSTALTLGGWNHIVASVGPAGQKIRINKVTVATNPAATTSYTGAAMKVFVREGGAQFGALSPVTIAAPFFYTTQPSDARTDAH